MSDYFNPANGPSDPGFGDTFGNTPVTTAPSTGSSYPVFLQMPLLVTSASSNKMRVGDTSPERVALLADAGGRPIDLTACTVVYALTLNGVQTLSQPATVLAALAGMVGYMWQAGDTATPGVYDESWHITDGGGNITTVPTAGPAYMSFTNG